MLCHSSVSVTRIDRGIWLLICFPFMSTGAMHKDPTRNMRSHLCVLCWMIFSFIFSFTHCNQSSNCKREHGLIQACYDCHCYCKVACDMQRPLSLGKLRDFVCVLYRMCKLLFVCLMIILHVYIYFLNSINNF